MAYVPEPLSIPIQKLDVVAIRELKQKFNDIFLPTEKVLDIAEYIVGLAKAHSSLFYPSMQAYVKNIYEENSPLPRECIAVNLTGLAGVGKTAMLNALVSSINAPVQIQVPNHTPVAARIFWVTEMDDNLTPTNLLRNFLALDGEDEKSNSAKGAQKRARERAYRRGVACVATDETQFQTFSTDATAQITKTLICQVRMGIPNVYVSNYSLGHRLAGRGQEDHDRLQDDPKVLVPDTSGHADWLWTIEEYRNIAPGIFQFDGERIADELHFWTAGLKRRLGRLLVLAAEGAIRTKKPVAKESLERAFRSTAYSMARKEVIILHKQAKTNRQGSKSRSDLWCPYDLDEDVLEEQAVAARALDEKKIAERYINSALTPEERKQAKAAQRTTKAGGKKPARGKRAGRGKSKAQALKEADREFHKEG
jgi:GTPase SAR1 family protein